MGAGCSEGTGQCLAIGSYICNVAGTGTECDATEGSSATEICDGIDNDCDGSVDEGFNVGEGCSEGLGQCLALGSYVCNGTGSGTECDANPGASSAETCDGLDNDCDGAVDEDFNVGAGCSEGTGQCLALGSYVCNTAGSGTECDATEGSASSEMCDGLDNDCDGAVDEGFNVGQSCNDGIGACFATGVTECAPDQNSAICNATAGSPTAELCDTIDNDCDGVINDGIPNLGTVCVVGDGICQESGVYVCDTNPNSPAICSATPSTPNPTETCDYQDDDCDGSVDEGFNVGVACSVGQGVCRRGGVNICQTGSAICDADVVTGSSETCNYLDDDCDGQTDENYRTGGLYTDDDNCGACGISCNDIYNYPSSYGTCEVSAGVARCQLGCDPGAHDLNGVPDDGCEFILDPNAIYVSGDDPNAADDATCGLGPIGTGDGNHPCLTITQALTRVSVTGREKLRIADALYREHIALQNGIDMLGGHRMDTWERHVSSTLTTLRGVSGSGHLDTITATNITTSTIVEGFVIEGMNAESILPIAGSVPVRGANSYAFYITGSNSNLQIIDNVIYAGDGAPGPTGSAGSNGAVGTDGSAGSDAYDTGSSSCTDSRVGGAGGTLLCGSVSVSGGIGGGNECEPVHAAENGDGSGRQGATGENNGGVGGVPGFDGYTDRENTCGLCRLGGVQSGLNGEQGGAGNHGDAGNGASDFDGSFAVGHWYGDPGEAGENGAHAGGGGGGGAGAGGDGRTWWNGACEDDLGGTGGGGGAGGCGGTTGQRGGPGGGSFAIFIANASGSVPLIENNSIYQARGGVGGQGGRGGAGGAGGSGATGGLEATSNDAFCTGTGGTGGNGGHGGHAGGGGGGAGGVSYGIFAPNVTGASNYAANNDFLAAGVGGNGGVGGTSPGTPGEDGIDGERANVEIR